MALRIKGRGGHGLDQLEYDIFWTEFRAIEESRLPVPDEEHEEEPSKEPPGGKFLNLTGKLKRKKTKCAVFSRLNARVI